MGDFLAGVIAPLAVGAVASTVPEDGQMRVTVTSVLGSLIVGLVATLSLPLGAALGIELKASKKFVAIVMAFGAGALIQALAVELAFGSAEHLIVGEKMAWEIAWLWVAVGFVVGGLVYSGANLALDNMGGAMRKAATAKNYLKRVRREKTVDMLMQLTASDLFRTVPASDLVKLVANGETRRLKGGSVVFTAGAATDGVYLVETGQVELVAHGDDGVAGSFEAGQCFGELELVTGEARLETATATQDAQLLFIPAADFEAVATTSAKLQAAVDDLVMVHTRGTFNMEDHLQRASEQRAHAPKPAHGAEDGHGGHEGAEQHGGGDDHGSPLSIFMGVLLDGIPEAIVLGAAFTTWATFNPTFLAAVFMANVPEAWASSAHMKASGMTRQRIYTLWLSLVIACAIFSILGNLFLATASPTTLVFVEAFAGGGVMAMVAQTMLPHAYEDGGAPVGIATIVGFLAAFIFTAQSLSVVTHH